MSRTLLFTLFAGLLSASQALADGEADQAGNQAAATGSISGHVVAAMKAPLLNAEVWLHKLERPRGYGPAIAKSKVDDSGGFSFSGLHAGRYVLAAEAEGLVASRSTIALLSGQQQKFEITLRPAVQSTVKFQSESGQPIAGVKLRDLRYQDINGHFYPYSPALQNLETLGLHAEASGADGLMKLPPLPEATVIITAIFDHEDFAPADFKDTTAKAGRIAIVTMHTAVKLKLKVDPTSTGKSISKPLLNVYPPDSSNPSTVLDLPLHVGEDGTATVNVAAGKYDIWLKGSADDLITPYYGSCEVSSGQNDTLTFTLRSKVPARGRIIDAETGQPVGNVRVDAEISNQPWTRADSARTDADGRYVLNVPPGTIRLFVSSDNQATAKPFVETEVLADGSTVLPEIEVLPVPKLKGRVVDPNGSPVAGAVVRLQGIYRLARQPPAVTDVNGYFELPVKFVPSGIGLASPQLLDVLHPTEALSVRTEVHLDQPKSLATMTIQLKPESYAEFLRRAIAPLTDSEQERVDIRAERLKSFASPIGQPAPALDGQAWFNTEKPMMSLADYRGKYVLLDFWAVWCGPCHGDFPDVKLLYETYKDHGLVVIGVADNSTAPELVREHAQQQGLKFPIVVDERDGRTYSAYEKFGTAQLIPDYVLIGPDGRILLTKEIGNYRFEYIRDYLFGSGQSP